MARKLDIKNVDHSSIIDKLLAKVFEKDSQKQPELDKF